MEDIDKEYTERDNRKALKRLNIISPGPPGFTY